MPEQLSNRQAEALLRATIFLYWSTTAAVKFPDKPTLLNISNKMELGVWLHCWIAHWAKDFLIFGQIRVTFNNLPKSLSTQMLVLLQFGKETPFSKLWLLISQGVKQTKETACVVDVLFYEYWGVILGNLRGFFSVYELLVLRLYFVAKHYCTDWLRGENCQNFIWKIVNVMPGEEIILESECLCISSEYVWIWLDGEPLLGRAFNHD